jgi:hypothetical protein
MALTAAQIKAERIAAEQEARDAAYQASLTAAPKTDIQQDALSMIAKATGVAVRNNAPLPAQAYTGIAKQPVVAKEDMPVSQTDFDKLIQTGDTAARKGDELLAAGDAAAIAAGGTPIGGNPLGTIKQNADAFDEMTSLLRQWGLESLAETYTQLMTEGLSAAQAINKLKYDKTINPKTGKPYNAAYTIRFAGNAARVAKGMNAYDEATYLDVENTYDETLRKYGLVNLISPDKNIAQAKYAEYMGNGIAPTEFAERIQTVADRVINMDPSIKAQFQAYYPSLTNTDIVSYFLDPKETLPVLKNKVTAAEIGAVAGAAKYGIDETRAMDLAKFGVTREKALTGYQDVAEAVPTGTKLSGIYNEEGIKYGQAVAEDEYLKQDAQAKLKRNRLASKERAMFSGQSGVDQNSLQRGKSSAY